MRALWLLLALTACGDGGDTDTDSDTDGGACGDVSTHTLSLWGLVHDASGAPVQGASVRLEDRGWNDGDVLGEGTSGADGSFLLEDLEVTSVEDCWGTMLSYWVVAEEGERSGEEQVNVWLYTAIDEGSASADASTVPVVIGD